MSRALDFEALRARFATEWDDPVPTYFANEEAGDPDESEPYVRFSVIPGNAAPYMISGVTSQLGRVWLQIFMPKNRGTVEAYDLADRFVGIFKGWRSDDGCLRIYESDTSPQPSGENGMYQVNVSIRYEALRRG